MPCGLRVESVMNTESSDQLKGRRAELISSDPWDLVTADGANLFQCTIVDISDSGDRERTLVQLDQPLEWRGRSIEYFVLQNRHGRRLFEEGGGGRRTVHCNAVAVPTSAVAAGTPWGADRVRGGWNAIVDLVYS